MYSIRGIVQCISLVLLSTQPIFSEIIRFNDGDITYEYDNSSTPLGRGEFGTVYEGIRTEGNHIESVAFKVLEERQEKILKESNIYEILGQHDSFPTFYRYFPETNETEAVLVMERIGKTLDDLWDEYRPFSIITTIQIGLQILDAIEWMHANGITHNGLRYSNVAVGYHNKSKIYLFDFDMAEMNKNGRTRDISFLSDALNDLIQSNLFDKANHCRNILKEIDPIVRKYCDKDISDDAFRNETFSKLRSILMRELESHKNDADYEKYLDIGYIQDEVDGINLLRKFIKQNDTTGVESLLQSDQQLNINAGFGNSSYFKPIHLAAELGNVRAVQLFIERGAEVNTKYNETYYALTPLHFAAMRGHADVVRVLCEHGAEVNAKLFIGMTPLHFAAMNGHIDVVKILFGHGADVKATDNDRNTPLHLAAMRGHFDVARILIEHDAEIDAKTINGMTPLYYAVQQGFMDIVQFLVVNGAEVNLKGTNGQTPLHHAAVHDSIDIARLCLERGAEIDAKSNAGKTPLHLAVEKGHLNITKFLIERGADTNAKTTRDLKTPLHFAASNGSVDIARFLIENRAEINAKCLQERTPLLYAAAFGAVELVQLLVERGADDKAADNNGQTPLGIAIENSRYYDSAIKSGYKEVIEILRKAEQKSAE